MYMCTAIHRGMVRLGASIGIFFLEGGHACVYLHDGKILFISSGCSYYVYSIKHILNMHLIFISIRIWGLISFMTIDSFQAICILFCSLLFISSVLSEEFKHPSRDCPQVMNYTPSKNQHGKPHFNALLFLCIYGAFCAGSGAFCWAGSRWCSARWTRFTAWQAVVPPGVFQQKDIFHPQLCWGVFPCPVRVARSSWQRGSWITDSSSLQKITPGFCPWLMNQDKKHFTPKSSPSPRTPSCLTFHSVVGLITCTPRFYRKTVSFQARYWVLEKGFSSVVCTHSCLWLNLLVPGLHGGERRTGDSSWHVEAPQSLLMMWQVLSEIKFAQSLGWKWTDRKLQRARIAV